LRAPSSICILIFFLLPFLPPFLLPSILLTKKVLLTEWTHTSWRSSHWGIGLYPLHCRNHQRTV
jgi:ABC-type Na+ efflux pump permease subunit